MRIRELAELIGVSDSYLSLVLPNTRGNFSDRYKDTIAVVLGASLTQLYTPGGVVGSLSRPIAGSANGVAQALAAEAGSAVGP